MRFQTAVVVLGLSLSILVTAQEPQAPSSTQTQSENRQVSPMDNATATVYFYRYKQYIGSALSPSVYCDEGELARMENGRFFVAKLKSGKHVFRSNDRQSGVETELKGGQEYYVRVELVPGMLKGHGRLILTQPEQGAYEIKKLKPLDADKVKDNEHVATVVAGG